MQDLHGGRKDQEVLSNLTRYAETQAQGYLKTAKKIEELLPQLEALILGVKEADKDFQMQRTEREEKRRALEKGAGVDGTAQPSAMSAALQNGSGLGRSGSVSVHSALNAGAPSNITITSASVAATSAPASALTEPSTAILSSSPGQASKFKGIRDLEERDYTSIITDSKDGQKGKEGLVWAMSRPGSHADPKGLNKQAWHKYGPYIRVPVCT